MKHVSQKAGGSKPVLDTEQLAPKIRVWPRRAILNKTPQKGGKDASE